MQNETLGQFGPKLKTREKISEEYSLSASVVKAKVIKKALLKDKSDNKNKVILLRKDRQASTLCVQSGLQGGYPLRPPIR